MDRVLISVDYSRHAMRIIILSAAILGTIIPETRASTSCDSDARKEQASVWLAEYTARTGKSPDFPAIRTLQRSVARHVISQLSPGERHAYWHQRVQSLPSHSLSPIQRQVVRKVTEQATLGLFATEAADDERLRQMHDLLLTAFEPLAAKTILYPLASASSCDCNLSEIEDCGPWYQAQCVVQQCFWQSSGCGLSGTSPCDGICCPVFGGEPWCP